MPALPGLPLPGLKSRQTSARGAQSESTAEAAQFNRKLWTEVPQ